MDREPAPVAVEPGKRGASRAIADHFARPYDALTTLLLIVPIFVFYQVGVMFLPIRNGADFLTDNEIRLWNTEPAAYVLLSLAIFLCFVLLARHERQRGRFRLILFLPLLVESAVYASVLGTIIVAVLREGHVLQAAAPVAIPRQLAQVSPWGRAVLCAGAGVHEEIVFRLVLFGGGSFLLRRLIVFGKTGAFVIALAGSSIAFAAFHYLGPLGDRFSIASFAFRALAGVAFAVLYRMRGLAVAIYTHALYDAFTLF